MASTQLVPIAWSSITPVPVTAIPALPEKVELVIVPPVAIGPPEKPPVKALSLNKQFVRVALAIALL